MFPIKDILPLIIYSKCNSLKEDYTAVQLLFTTSNKFTSTSLKVCNQTLSSNCIMVCICYITNYSLLAFQKIKCFKLHVFIKYINLLQFSLHVIIESKLIFRM